MFDIYWNKFVFALLFLLSLVFGVGCNSPLFNQHAQIADSARGAIEAVKQTMGSESIGQYLANAHVNNPGVRAGGGVEYYGYIRYEGVDANVSGAAQGKLDRPLTQADRDAIREVSQSTTLNAQAKRDALERIFNKLAPTTQPAGVQ